MKTTTDNTNSDNIKCPLSDNKFLNHIVKKITSSKFLKIIREKGISVAINIIKKFLFSRKIPNIENIISLLKKSIFNKLIGEDSIGKLKDYCMEMLLKTMTNVQPIKQINKKKDHIDKKTKSVPVIEKKSVPVIEKTKSVSGIEKTKSIPVGKNDILMSYLPQVMTSLPILTASLKKENPEMVDLIKKTIKGSELSPIMKMAIYSVLRI